MRISREKRVKMKSKRKCLFTKKKSAKHKFKGKCHHCQKPGHKEKDCYSKRNSVNVVKENEEEYLLATPNLCDGNERIQLIKKVRYSSVLNVQHEIKYKRDKIIKIIK